MPLDNYSSNKEKMSYFECLWVLGKGGIKLIKTDLMNIIGEKCSLYIA